MHTLDSSCALIWLLSLAEMGSKSSLGFRLVPLSIQLCNSHLLERRQEKKSAGLCSRLQRCQAKLTDGDENIVDAVVIEESDNNISITQSTLRMPNSGGIQENDGEKELSSIEYVSKWFKGLFRRLAALSLEDYKLRSAIIKDREAGRQLDESLARMRGDTPGYVRPMYADQNSIGPLGTAEKNAVGWLTKVIEEEAKRAKRIIEKGGEVVRPIDVGNADDGVNDGPLAELERKAVKFLAIIAESETYRASEGKLRPMDLQEAKRGPLGEAEAKLVKAFEEIEQAERQRMEVSRRRGGEIVRPIDVPGPLGEIEKAVLSIVTAERRRSIEGQKRNNGRILRPMDSPITNPLGDAERKVSESLERLQEEERIRLRSVRKYLENNRPMEKDPESTLGFTEAIIVGIARGPKLVMSVINRVSELLKSSTLSEEDKTDIQSRLLEASSLSVSDDGEDASTDKEEDSSGEGGSARLL
mmetsp:Transcript_28278/g.40494  ORF Transcript_28278/g.40494 Transcript_28278/m.40494 type:complete len:472 (+) Transcript_28278:234-1649(+)|eukprot:CAMPEP_0172431616 /NCGR_PEP_ID=MMETSP1064-20121228/59188_1 /TAXON_ID=202472 /ORGANISM="Aulacoseira subarctica , Strain CCAP 1002/5" /LENGTH=471 /DNA_ID=CAMNT_0013178411 /DNA_START=169 /DNA_END=1584 /DNA_ORIENTATION=+